MMPTVSVTGRTLVRSRNTGRQVPLDDLKDSSRHFGLLRLLSLDLNTCLWWLLRPSVPVHISSLPSRPCTCDLVRENKDPKEDPQRANMKKVSSLSVELYVSV